MPILLAAAGKLPHVTVHGAGWDTPDGTCIRDYVHVLVASAVLAKREQGWRPRYPELATAWRWELARRY